MKIGQVGSVYARFPYGQTIKRLLRFIKLVFRLIMIDFIYLHIELLKTYSVYLFDSSNENISCSIFFEIAIFPL